MTRIKYKNNDKWLSIHPSDVNAISAPKTNTQENIGIIPPSLEKDQVWATDIKGIPNWKTITSKVIYKYIIPNSNNTAILYRWGPVVQLAMYDYTVPSTWANGDNTGLQIPYGFRPPHGAWTLLPGYTASNPSARFEITDKLRYMGDSSMGAGAKIWVSATWMTSDPPIDEISNWATSN